MSSFGDYQDTLINHQTTQISHHTTNHSKLEDIKTKLDAVVTNTANINLNVDTLEVNTDGLEGLQTTTNSKLDTINTTLTAGGIVDTSALSTHALQTAIHNRQDDQLGHLNTAQLKLVSLDTNFSAHKTANNTHLQNIYNRQDNQLIPLNGIALSSTTTATKISALESANHSDLSNIFSRQDDILTSNNATKLTNATIATKITELEHTNHTDLNNIYSRQDDILTSNNATKLTNATIATKMTSLESTNHADLGNIFSRQDDILTSTNAVKTNTQSVENCVSSNKMNVNISSGISDLATESTLQTIAEFNCDTTDTTITSCVLPSGASTSVKQGAGLPSALSSDNLKVSLKESIAVGVTNGTLTNLNDAINSNRLDVNIANGNISGFSTATLQGAGLPTALSSDNLKVSLKESIAVGVTNGTLTNLNDAINSNRLDVNIANGNITGFSTATLQGAGLPTALSSDNLKVSLKESIAVGVTNGTLTNLNDAINSNRLDVNIANGNITGFATSANQSTANGHLLALANVVNPAIATATATTIPNKLDTIETTVNGIETKTTLHTTSELKELLSGVTINSGNLSSEFDFENYRHARFFGITTSSIGTDFIVMGSNTSGGTYYVMGENLRSETLGSVHYIYSPHIENLPRYVKIFNKSGSTNYVFTKLYVQLSEGRVAV